MVKPLVIIGNWKMNKGPQATEAFLKSFATLYKAHGQNIGKGVQFGLAVPFVSLMSAKRAMMNGMMLAAQNMHAEAKGAFTGEVSPAMLTEIGVSHVIIGHSERRAMFAETDLTVNAKLKAAFANNLIPVLCVGETLAEFEANKTAQVLDKQLKADLVGLTPDQMKKLIVAYEPIWAIGTGKSATPAQAEAACAIVRKYVTPTTIIQYGGSVKPETIAELMMQKNINGALVGNASLEPESFIKLLTLGK